jgi:hypothetical protein
VVDGAVVGKTPWEGALTEGDHVLALRGPASTGTGPSRATVKRDATTTLTLAAGRLDSIARIETDRDATISLDGVAVAKNTWEGPLPSGAHHVEVRAEGSAPVARDVVLAAGSRDVIRLSSVPSASPPPNPAHVRAEIAGGVALTGRLGGDLSSTCDESCNASLTAGEYVRVSGAYELPSRVAFGADVSFLHPAGRLQNRADVVFPNGRAPASGRASDHLTLSSALFGAMLETTFGETFAFTARFGAGVAIAFMNDERSGTYVEPSGASDATTSAHANGSFVYLAPELRVGVRATPRLLLGGGVAVLGLVALHAPTRTSGPDEVLLSSRDLASYGAASLTGSLLVVPVPLVTASYAFLAKARRVHARARRCRRRASINIAKSEAIPPPSPARLTTEHPPPLDAGAAATAGTHRPLALQASPLAQSSLVVHAVVQAPAAQRYGAQVSVVPSAAFNVTASVHIATGATVIAGTHAVSAHREPVAQSSSIAHEVAHRSLPPHR